MANPNHTLGRGELHFARFSGTSFEANPGAERYFGNSPEVSINVETETLDHYNSDAGIKEIDDSVVLETTRAGTFILDDISFDNIAMMLFGTASAVTEVAAPGQTETFTNRGGDYTMQLGVSTAKPAGARNVSSVVVQDAGGGGVTYVADTDYTVDAARGRITVIDGSSLAAYSGDVDVAYDIDGSTRTQVVSGNTPIYGALRYIAKNPKGEQRDFFMPFVEITPNGDFALKGDEWQQISFNLKVFKPRDRAAIYADGLPA